MPPTGGFFISRRNCVGNRMQERGGVATERSPPEIYLYMWLKDIKNDIIITRNIKENKGVRDDSG